MSWLLRTEMGMIWYEMVGGLFNLQSQGFPIGDEEKPLEFWVAGWKSGSRRCL